MLIECYLLDTQHILEYIFTKLNIEKEHNIIKDLMKRAGYSISESEKMIFKANHKYGRIIPAQKEANMLKSPHI